VYHPNIFIVLRITKHVSHTAQVGTGASDNRRRLINRHVLLHRGAALLGSTALDSTLFVDTHALDAAQQIQDNGTLHALVAAVAASELRQSAVHAVLVAHAWQ
jgi:hypothetical protein